MRLIMEMSGSVGDESCQRLSLSDHADAKRFRNADHDEGQGDNLDHEHCPPAEASVTASGVAARLDRVAWHVVTAAERRRTIAGGGGELTLQDVVARAVRRR
jgi:hypothetical protein